MKDVAMQGSGQDRREHDSYDTIEAAWIVAALINAGIRIRPVCWEPSAGANHLVYALQNHSISVFASDIQPRAPHIVQADFLAATELPNDLVGGVVMNPPYKNINAHIVQALALTEAVDGQVILLARSELSHAKSRRHLFADNWRFRAKIELTSRPRWVEGTTGSPRHNFSWFVWDSDGDGTTIRWAPKA